MHPGRGGSVPMCSPAPGNVGLRRGAERVGKEPVEDTMGKGLARLHASVYLGHLAHGVGVGVPWGSWAVLVGTGHPGKGHVRTHGSISVMGGCLRRWPAQSPAQSLANSIVPSRCSGLCPVEHLQGC